MTTRWQILSSPCIVMRARSDLWTSRARLKMFVPVIGFLYWVVWQLSIQQIYFSVNGPFVPSWLGLICLYKKIVLDIEIVTTKGSKLVFLIKNCYCWGKNFVPDTSLLGKKLYTAPICRGKKLYRAVTPIVPSGALFLLHIQDAGYNFTTKPFSSRPGGYKGAIDRKRILTMIITEISVVFSLFLIRWTPASTILIIKHQRLSKAVKALIQRDDEEEACWLSSFFFKLGLQKHNFE